MIARAVAVCLLASIGGAALPGAAGCSKAKTEAVAFVNEGVRAFERGDVATAQAHFARAARLDPENPHSHYHLGLVKLYRKDEPAQALVHFETAERLAPDDHDVLFQLGRLHVELGDPAAGLGFLDRAVAADPSHALAWHYKGLALAGQGNPQAADQAFREACAKDPFDARPFLALADLYERHGADMAARAVYEEGLRHSDGSPDLLNGLAVLELRHGEVERAIGHLDTALSRDSQRTDSLFNVGFAYAEAGKTKEAVQHLAAYLALADPVGEKGNLRVARALHDTLLAERK